MDNSLKEKFSRFCAGGVLVMTLCFMAVLTVQAFVGTASVTTGGGDGEVLSFSRDNTFINILLSAAFFAPMYFLLKVSEKISARALTAALVLWAVILSAAFVCSAKLQPSQDSYIITFFASQAAKGDYSYYHEYFCFFPYQFGFALYEELFFRLFYLILPAAPEGFAALSVQLMNVLYNALTFLALVKISRVLFKSERAEKLTALLLFLCFQPMLFTTFMYGNTPALAFAVLAVWMFLLFQESGTVKYALLCTAFISIGTLLKLNTLIYVVAISIVWLISVIRKPSLRSLLLMLLMIASVLILKPLPQRYYEAKMGEELGKGIPQSGWLAMGLHEGQSGPGWYDPTYTTTAFIASDYAPDVCAGTAKSAISERLAEFAKDPGGALEFFGRKLSSQWNEPSYESLWTNQVRRSYSSSGKIYAFVCEDHADEVYMLMNIYQQCVFAAFTAGLVLLMKKRDINTVLLPLVILGAMLYHIMFEAKSQYALGYFMLMMPVAAFAIERIFALISGRKEPKRWKTETSPKK